MSAPSVLLPYQQAWIADRSPVKICEKSRRVGLSWCEAADDVLLAATAGKGGMNVWYIGYNKDMALEFVNDCAEWARTYNKAAGQIEEVLIEDEKKQILSFVIRFDSGWRITALSSRPSNLRGKQGKVVIDEAAFHDDLEGLLKAAIALLMWGGRVVIISTHNGDDNPFNEVVGDVRAGKKPYSLHRIDIDQALEQGLYRRICLKLGTAWSESAQDNWRQDLIDFYGEAAEEELFCVPSKGSGIYFPRILIESCMSAEIPVLRWSCSAEFATGPDDEREAACRDWCEENLEPLLDEMDPLYPSFLGEDFGRTGDLTVLWPLREVAALRYETPAVIELRNVPFRQQEQLLFYFADRLPRFRGGAFDARGNGQYLAEVAMQRYGAWRIAQIMLTQEWYRENMPKYKSAYEDKRIKIPMNGDILDDHRMVRMEKGVAKPPEGAHAKGRDGLQRHCDSAVAGALAWFAVTSMAGAWKVEHRSAEPRMGSYRLDDYTELEGRDGVQGW